MNILFLVDHYPPAVGGAETVYEHIAGLLAKKNHSATVLTTAHPGRPADTFLNGVRVVSAGTNRYFFMFAAVRHAWRLSRSADLIQTATYNAALIAWIIGRLRHKPVYLIVHELLRKLWFKTLNPLSALLHYAFEALIMALPFTHYIVFSEFTKHQLSSILHTPYSQLSLIPHGIDLTLFNSQNADPRLRERLGYTDRDFVLLYFGRAGVLKGVDTLVESMNLLHQLQRPQGQPVPKLCLLLGKNPPSGYRRIQKKAAKNPKISFLDSVKRADLPAYLAMADAIVVPSLQEGFGFSAVETCAMNRPLIVSHAGALPENVFGRVIFVKPGDAHSLLLGILKALRGDWEHHEGTPKTWHEADQKYAALYENVKKRDNKT